MAREQFEAKKGRLLTSDEKACFSHVFDKTIKKVETTNLEEEEESEEVIELPITLPSTPKTVVSLLSTLMSVASVPWRRPGQSQISSTSSCSRTGSVTWHLGSSSCC